MYKVEIDEVIIGSVYNVKVTDEKNNAVILNCGIEATSAEDAEQFVIDAFKSSFEMK